MSAHVPLVVGVVAEVAATDVAAVRLLACVDAQVLLVAVKARQPLPADITRKRFVAIAADFPVNAHVFGPLAALVKYLATDCADIRVGFKTSHVHALVLAVS